MTTEARSTATAVDAGDITDVVTAAASATKALFLFSGEPTGAAEARTEPGGTRTEDTATAAAEGRATAPPDDIRDAAATASPRGGVRRVVPGVVSRDGAPTDGEDVSLASVLSEEANAGADEINEPTPRANANAPTRPTNWAPLNGRD